MPVFGVQVDTIFLIASLPADKIAKAIAAASASLLQKSLSLKDVQRLTGYLCFCAKVIRLGWVFMRPLWNFVAKYPPTAGGLRRRLPAQVRLDPSWWNTRLPVFNGVIFFDNQSREVFQLYRDASLIGLGGFFCAALQKHGLQSPSTNPEAFMAKTPNFDAITDAQRVFPTQLEDVGTGTSNLPPIRTLQACVSATTSIIYNSQYQRLRGSGNFVSFSTFWPSVEQNQACSFAPASLGASVTAQVAGVAAVAWRQQG